MPGKTKQELEDEIEELREENAILQDRLDQALDILTPPEEEEPEEEEEGE
jgi:hypothetical protein